eukprot:CAMPEP_0174736048 /NCGR_PEP_ID=MMETSP1094-20130205/65991_1 /TAXON_ID=156173 /ORGANISM="Chrysochromulina brevifilum, Strain UTEX LB 985" /LENGTH=78 /DNA_ID=CAMNT_0015939097 /DNA_START=546 /DNA_END=782 /DNA_ORIENTATION=+
MTSAVACGEKRPTLPLRDSLAVSSTLQYCPRGGVMAWKLRTTEALREAAGKMVWPPTPGVLKYASTVATRRGLPIFSW